jgi:ataxin-3
MTQTYSCCGSKWPALCVARQPQTPTTTTHEESALFPRSHPPPPPHQLSAYLDSLIDQGYTIYVVRGALPAQQLPPEAGDAEGRDGGRWFTPEEAKDATKEAATTRQVRSGLFMAQLDGALANLPSGQASQKLVTHPLPPKPPLA